MSHFRKLMCCVALLSSIGGCAKQPTPDNRAEDERVIREIEIEASKALAARDLGRLVSTVLRSCRPLRPGQPYPRRVV
jgi:hypothetical protein